MGVRVYELARTLGVSSKELMHELKKQGVELKSHMSSIDDETAELVVDLLKAAPTSAIEETPPTPALAAPSEAPAMETPPTVIEEAEAPSRVPTTPVVTPEPTP